MDRLLRTVVVPLLLLSGSWAFAQDGPPGPPPPPFSLNVYNGTIPEADAVYYVAPDGNDDHPGTEAQPFATLPRAVSVVTRGDVIVMRGGVHYYDHTISINSPSGFTGEMITLMAYPGEAPILDFWEQPKQRNIHGIRLNANYWHVIGITVRYASHNGIRMDGSFNILEQVTAYGNHDTGIHMAGGASFNLIKNTDSFWNFNYDPFRTPRIGNNADGFGAKTNVGPGNRYVGCRAWENSDDGFDFWEATNTIVIENSWAFGNGDASVFDFPVDFEGNGNGFKLGGNQIRGDHVVLRSMAFDNFGHTGNAKGFDFNNNPGAMRLEHNTAYNNGRNFFFPLNTPGGDQGIYLNNLSLPSNLQAIVPPSAVVAGNSWDTTPTATVDMVLSVDTAPAQGPRQPDGSLPHIDLLRPVPGSAIVDAGVGFGQPFYGSAPDIGAFEHAVGEPVEPWFALDPTDVLAAGRVYDIEAGDLWSTQFELTAGVEAYPDGNALVSSLSSDIQVAQWIRTAQATRGKNYLFTAAELEVSQGTHVLVAHADAITTKPSWLGDFEQTNAQIVLQDGGDQHTFTVYRKAVAAGTTVSLGRNAIMPTDSPMYLVMLGAVGPVSSDDDPLAAGSVTLHPNYPNPFAAQTNLSYSLPDAAHVTIQAYDLMGRRVAEIAEEHMPAGNHTVVWTPESLSSGVYYVRLQAGSVTQTQRVVLVR